MQLPRGATVAVADGETLNLFRNTGDEGHPKLAASPDAFIDASNKSSGGRHQSNSANHDDRQIDEDGFAAGVVEMLNKQVLDGKISDLVIVAAPKTLGEMRKHYHKSLSAVLVGEIAKDLTGHSMQDVEKAVVSA